MTHWRHPEISDARIFWLTVGLAVAIAAIGWGTS